MPEISLPLSRGLQLAPTPHAFVSTSRKPFVPDFVPHALREQYLSRCNTGWQDLDQKYWRDLLAAHERQWKIQLDWIGLYDNRFIPTPFNTPPAWRKDKNVCDALRAKDFDRWVKAWHESPFKGSASISPVLPDDREAKLRNERIARDRRYRESEAGALLRPRICDELQLHANADFLRRQVPLFVLKALGLVVNDAKPTGPFIYATVYLPDIGMEDRPWLYIGKRIDPADYEYLGSGTKLLAHVKTMPPRHFKRYTVCSLPVGATARDLEQAEQAVLMRFRASQDHRLFNLVNS
jgi:hypothetical protein